MDLDFESLSAPEPAPVSEGESEFDLGDLSSESAEFDLDLSEPLNREEAEVDLGLDLGETSVEQFNAEQDLGLGLGEESAAKSDQGLSLDEETLTEGFEAPVDAAVDADLSFDLDLAESSVEEVESEIGLGLEHGEDILEKRADVLADESTDLSANTSDEFAGLDLDLHEIGDVGLTQDEVLAGIGEAEEEQAGTPIESLKDDFSDLDLGLGAENEGVSLDKVNIEQPGEFAAKGEVNPSKPTGTAEEPLDLDSFEDIADLDNVVSFESPDTAISETTEHSSEELLGLSGDIDDLANALGKEAEGMSLDIGGAASDDLLAEPLEEIASSEASDWEVEPAMSSFGEMDEEYSLFESTDDVVGTKLDLAKAYIDMGDQDGARSILDEVVKEGSDTQREEAEQLMQQMG